MFVPNPDSTETNGEYPTELERISEEERHRLGGAGVGFDGRKYRYKSFSYDSSSDTLNYSHRDRFAPGSDSADRPAWVGAIESTAIERQQMANLGITYDDNIAMTAVGDAVDDAQLKH